MKICVIFNPSARGEKARQFRNHLASLSAQCTLKPTFAPGTGQALAAEGVREGFETIVAAGGDGTVNEVVNGIADETHGLKQVRLAVLPLGTVNVFAKELRLPAQFTPAWQVIQQSHETVIDLGEAEFQAAGKPHRRCFVQMAGAGVDSRAVVLVNWAHKKRVGMLAYVFSALKALREAKPQIVITDGHDSVAGEQMLIGNGRFYGGKFSIFPQADLRDGLLDATVLTRADWSTLLRGGWGLLRNQLYRTRGVTHLRGGQLTLNSALPIPVHLDGENVGHLPVKFSVRPLALRVLVP